MNHELQDKTSKSIPSLSANNDETITIDRALETQEDDNLIGKTIGGKYEVLSLLGKGGMSVVYKARHVVMDKILAIKVLHMDLARDAVSLRRFKQEAQASSQLTHSGIVGVHDCGEAENGMPYIVMDLVEGRTLSEIIKEDGPLNLEQFLQIMQQVSSALKHAHEHGVVHRDLKPSNIMITKTGSQEQARIVDFGIAKLMTQENDGQQQLTQTGEVFGSPLYMSPEQCSGSQVDRRSDIYSLGCVMYESLSGQVPLRGNSVVETINKHVNEPPPALIAPQLNDDSKQKLELMLLRCLAKLPEDRFQNVSEIESELRSLSLKAKTGLLSKLGGAWDLASAKRRARKRNNIPLLVGALSISMLSILMLICGLFKAQHDLEAMERSRIVFDEISIAHADFLMLGEATRQYFSAIMFQQSDATEEMKQYKRAERALLTRLDKVDRSMELDTQWSKEARQRYRKQLQRVPDVAQVSMRALERAQEFGVQSIWNPKNIAIAAHLSRVCEDGSKVLQDMHRQAKKLDSRHKRQFKQTEELIRWLAFSCLAINACVVSSLIIYFTRGNPERMRKLSEHAAKLSKSRGLKPDSPSGADEVAELDSVLTELASALSEAEAREKALLLKLKEHEGNDSLSKD